MGLARRSPRAIIGGTMLGIAASSPPDGNSHVDIRLIMVRKQRMRRHTRSSRGAALWLGAAARGCANHLLGRLMPRSCSM